VTTADHNLVGDATGNGLENGVNGNIVGGYRSVMGDAVFPTRVGVNRSSVGIPHACGGEPQTALPPLPSIAYSPRKLKGVLAHVPDDHCLVPSQVYDFFILDNVGHNKGYISTSGDLLSGIGRARAFAGRHGGRWRIGSIPRRPGGLPGFVATTSAPGR